MTPNPAFPAQLGYVEITADFTTTSATAVDVSGLSLAGMVVGSTYPIRVWAHTPYLQSSIAADIVVMQTLRATTILGGAVQTITGANAGPTICVPMHDNPGAGTYTIKTQLYRFSGSGTAKLGALVSLPTYNFPAGLRVEEVNA